ncbi:MAG TPA: DUF2752 domain-containing protein [Cyclobacteriaceae bacterium]|jgi:hypothetical protein
MLKHQPPANAGGFNFVRIFLRVPREAWLWMAALVALAIHDPDSGKHLALCPFHYLGFDFCPGCGLGRSISYALHGEFASSLSMHPLGVFALIVLSYRILQLTRHQIAFTTTTS